MTSILIVEDDNDINNLICNTLKAEGYQCERAFDGKEGADKIEQNRYDLLLLDIMLPEITGYELLDYVRRIGDTPVIIISAMGQVDERIRGLRMGADDYICKPFQIGELLARVETVLRRTQRMAERLEIEDVAIDPKSRTVTKAGEQVELTVKEFDLLYELMKNKNGFAVAYNAQIVVDSETHLIRDFQMTNQVTDHGLLESTISEVKEAESEKS